MPGLFQRQKSLTFKHMARNPTGGGCRGQGHERRWKSGSSGRRDGVTNTGENVSASTTSFDGGGAGRAVAGFAIGPLMIEEEQAGLVLCMILLLVLVLVPDVMV